DERVRGWRSHPDRRRPHRGPFPHGGRGRCPDAGVEDVGLPPHPQRRPGSGPLRPQLPGPRARRARLPPGRLLRDRL
ncbi:MAG: hypothetical protein AVDCRST_MAG61-1479, partial [uncultured Friedmanniella sp.]